MQLLGYALDLLPAFIVTSGAAYWWIAWHHRRARGSGAARKCGSLATIIGWLSIAVATLGFAGKFEDIRRYTTAELPDISLTPLRDSADVLLGDYCGIDGYGQEVAYFRKFRASEETCAWMKSIWKAADERKTATLTALAEGPFEINDQDGAAIAALQSGIEIFLADVDEDDRKKIMELELLLAALEIAAYVPWIIAVMLALKLARHSYETTWLQRRLWRTE